MNFFSEDKNLTFFFFGEEITNISIFENSEYNPYNSLINYYRRNEFIYNYYYEDHYLSFYNFSFYGYVKYEEEGKNNTDFNFQDYSDDENSIEIDEITNNSYSVKFNNNFGYAKSINFTLILSDIKNKEFFKSKISVFENFYLNSQYNNSDFEFHNFSLTNLTHIGGINAKIEIQNSQKFNFSQPNKEYIITIMIQMGPPEMVYIFIPKVYKTSKESGDNEEEEENEGPKDNDSNDSNKTKIILIILGIFFLIVIIIIIVIILVKRKKGMPINELEQGFNISMADDSLKQ